MERWLTAVYAIGVPKRRAFRDEMGVCVKRVSPIAIGPQTSLAHALSG
jgi:hypothetical protein